MRPEMRSIIICFPEHIWVLGRMRCVGCMVSLIREKTDTYRILVRKPLGKRSLGRPRCR